MNNRLLARLSLCKGGSSGLCSALYLASRYLYEEHKGLRIDTRYINTPDRGFRAWLSVFKVQDKYLGSQVAKRAVKDRHDKLQQHRLQLCLVGLLQGMMIQGSARLHSAE